jgi:hypothetical protein
MSVKLPYFSIAMPVYEMKGHGVHFLDFSFKKFLDQSFKDFQIVISDHSLNKDISNLCFKWSKILNIKYIKFNEKRGSSSANINNAIKNSDGEWIKILFQDDFLFNENSLEILKISLEKYSPIWLASACEHSNDGEHMYKKFFPKWNDKIYHGVNTISSPSVITIKNKLNTFFDEDLIWLMDVDFYQKMFNIYGLPLFINEITVVNRTWGNRLSDTISKVIKENEKNKLLNRYN